MIQLQLRQNFVRRYIDACPTIRNAIDTERNEDGSRFFSPGHFDLIGSIERNV